VVTRGAQGEVRNFSDMDKLPQPTLKDVAKVVGVSSMTVSLALRGDARISAARRRVIQDTAQRMGYRPNPMAKAMAHYRWNSLLHPISAELAWLNNWKNPKQLRAFREFDLYWQGATYAATHAGFRLEEFVVDETLTYARLEKILIARSIQGILVPPHGASAVTCPQSSSMNWSRFSVVRFGYSIPNFPAHVVAGNHLHGTLMAFREIQKRNYKRIGYACYLNTGTLSKAGFFMGQSILPRDERLPVLELNPGREDHLQQLHCWIRDNRPDAILSELSGMAAWLQQLGYCVPGDIGLAAISVLDGNADAGIFQNSEEIGRAAVETIINLIHHHETGIPEMYREFLINACWRDGKTLPDRNFSGKATDRLISIATKVKKATA